MTLSDYLKSAGTTQAEFAAATGYTQAAVSGWSNGAMPDKAALAAIYSATRGAVTANDFAGQKPTPSKRAKR